MFKGKKIYPLGQDPYSRIEQAIQDFKEDMFAGRRSITCDDKFEINNFLRLMQLGELEIRELLAQSKEKSPFQ